MAFVSEEVEKFNIRFLKEIEKRPIIYSRACYDGSGCDSERAWGEVATSMGVSKTACKLRWRNLRTVFARHLKTKKKRTYYLTNAFKFLLPHTKTTAEKFRPMHVIAKENLKAKDSASKDDLPIKIEYVHMEDGDNMVDEDDVNKDLDEEDIGDNVEEMPESTRSLSVEGDEETRVAEDNDYTPIKKRTGKKKRRRVKIGAVNVEPVQVSARTESMKMFLLSLLPELEEMSDIQLKVFKRKIFTLMDDITDEFD